MKEKKALISLLIILITFIIWEFWLSSFLQFGEIDTGIENIITDLYNVREYFIQNTIRGTIINIISGIAIFYMVCMLIKNKVKPPKESIKKIITVAIILISIIQIINFTWRFIYLTFFLDNNEKMYKNSLENLEMVMTPEYIKENKWTKKTVEERKQSQKTIEETFEAFKIIGTYGRNSLWIMLLDIPIVCITINNSMRKYRQEDIVDNCTII